ncbi:MAG: LacI family DNA-binding transcriptional regulator [Christensenellales bacterium]
MAKKVTIREIAEKCGVSKSTVALALQDKYGVNSSKRAKILLVAYELGYNFEENYKKHRIKLDKIALIIPYDYCVRETYWSGIIEAIEKSVVGNGCFLDIFNYAEIADLNEFACKLKIEGYLGVVIIHHNNEDLMSALSKQDLSCIVIEPKYYTKGDFISISPNDYVSSRRVAEYFYKKGHRKLCFFGNIFHNDTFMQRLNGFADFCKLNKEVEFVAITDENMRYELQNSDFDTFKKVFSMKDAPTALLCATDTLALLVIDELKKLDKKVPEDVSIICFGDKDRDEGEPFLSSLSVNMEFFGGFVSDCFILKKYPKKFKFCFQIVMDLTENKSVIERN